MDLFETIAQATKPVNKNTRKMYLKDKTITLNGHDYECTLIIELDNIDATSIESIDIYEARDEDYNLVENLDTQLIDTLDKDKLMNEVLIKGKLTL